ncbi:MAG: hypothetical protein FWD61_18215, partial [Phycisphaerales bacterium]|nr:hypothetical protein [Phycisphaerales bacterium]
VTARWGLAAAAMLVGLAVGGCPTVKDIPQAATQGAGKEMTVAWRVRVARREVSYVRLDLPVVTKGMRVEIGRAGGWVGTIGLCTSRVYRGGVEGPMVDQLMGQPKFGTDAGSYLVPLAEENGSYVVGEPMPLYVRVEVAPGQEAGEYVFPVRVMSGASSGSQTQGLQSLSLAVEVSEVALPTEPRVLAAVTTTTETLAKIYPETFGKIIATYLDRNDPEHAEAVAQLDRLMTEAQREGGGMGLFVEDIGPRVKVDNVGAVQLDWDAYDRVMQPYMDGTAFADRVPLQVWLAPVPPRRIRDSVTQLRQYVAACAEHFAAKGWVATPALMHPAMVEAIGKDEKAAKKLRADVEQVLKLHMTRDMLAVTTPDGRVEQSRMWVVDDSDPRLPPAGAMGTEFSVRVWPWVCAARGVKGFVWRDGVGVAGEGEKALLVVEKPDARSQKPEEKGEVFPTLRLAWLQAGLNDTAMLGLLERRAEAGMVNEVLAGVVGRTGLIEIPSPLNHQITRSPDSQIPLPMPSPGFLYAGWLQGKEQWAMLPGMLDRLVAANDPGQESVKRDDPMYLAAKLWLAKSRRPVARVAGYRFAMKQAEAGLGLVMDAEVLVENPVAEAVEMEGRFLSLPGDLNLLEALNEVKGRRTAKVGANGLSRMVFPLAGYVEGFRESPKPAELELAEKTGGAKLNLAVGVPVYRMRATENPPKIDGKASDWPVDAQVRVYGEMKVGTRYLSRPDLLSASGSAGGGGAEGNANVAMRTDDETATARWMYDDENLYVLIRCPQRVVSDERNTDWPAGAEKRWWGTDGVQIQLASLSVMGSDGKKGEGKVMTIAFKPGGVMLTRTAEVKGGEVIKWTDGPTGVKYGISVEKEMGSVKGYLVEAAIPRKWFGKEQEGGGAAWRVNVLRHRAADMASMSWSGPVVNDDDVAMMGVLIGE